MSNYLILGATGKTARRVIPHLVSAGHTVKAGARNPGDASPGVEPIVFDWDDRSPWDDALAGVSGVYVVPPAFRLDYVPAVTALLERARAAGVERVVFLSARGAELDPDGALAQTEAALRESGLAFTVLRPTWFLQNVTEGFLRPGIDSAGMLVAPTGDGGEPFIDVEDVGAVAAAALTDPRHAGETYELAGTEALTHAGLAALVSPYAGREVTHVDLPRADWEQAAAGMGVPADYAALLGGLCDLIRSGDDAYLTDGVQRALGRDPVSPAEWAAREAGSLRQAPVPA